MDKSDSLNGKAAAAWSAQAVLLQLGTISYEPRHQLPEDCPSLEPLVTKIFDSWETAFMAARQHALNNGYDLAIRHQQEQRVQLLCWKSGRTGEKDSCYPLVWSFVKEENGRGGWMLGSGQHCRKRIFKNQTGSAPWLSTLTEEEEVYIFKLRQCGCISGSDEFEEVSRIHEVINLLRKKAGKPFLLSTRALHRLWEQTRSIVADQASSSTPRPARCKFWPPSPEEVTASSPGKFWPSPPLSPSSGRLSPLSPRALPEQAQAAAESKDLPEPRLTREAAPDAIGVISPDSGFVAQQEGYGPAEQADTSMRDRLSHVKSSSERKTSNERHIPLLQAHRAGPNTYFADAAGVTFSRTFESQYPWSGLETFAETTASAMLLLPRCLIAVDVEGSEEDLLPVGSRLVRQSRPDLWVLQRPELGQTALS